MVPEIRLHLADDAFRVWEAAERHLGEGNAEGTELPPPFWAFAWPGGQALARYVLDHPEVVAGRSDECLGVDRQPAALAAVEDVAVVAVAVDPFARPRLNAAANHVRVDLTGDVPRMAEDAAVILAADVWYQRELAIARSPCCGGPTTVAQTFWSRHRPAFLPGRCRASCRPRRPGPAELENTPVKRV
jgi:predicted nicotinamide N-methyase